MFCGSSLRMSRSNAATVSSLPVVVVPPRLSFQWTRQGILDGISYISSIGTLHGPYQFLKFVRLLQSCKLRRMPMFSIARTRSMDIYFRLDIGDGNTRITNRLFNIEIGNLIKRHGLTELSTVARTEATSHCRQKNK